MGKGGGKPNAEHVIAGRTATLATQGLLRETARSGWSNARQKMAFVLLTVLIAIAGAYLARHLAAPRRLVFATGPEGSAEYAFAQRLAAASAQNLRIRVVPQATESSSAALSLFAQRKADLAIVRSDSKVPARARAVAILDHALLVVGAPRKEKPKSFAALKGKRIAMIGEDARDGGLVNDILSYYDATPQASGPQLEQHRPEDWPRLFDPGGPAAVFWVIRKSAISTDKFLPVRTQKPNFELLDLDGGKALAARYQGLSDDTIEGGLISLSPKIPSDDVDTISLEETLICHAKLSEALGTELADVVYENKDQLGEAGRFATAIEPPSTDKDAAILAHPGVAEYVDDETKTFFDRYSDMIYIGMSVASIVGSIFVGLYSTVTKISPVRASHLSDAVFGLGDRAAAADTLEEVAALERELNQLLAEVLAGIRDGSIANEGFEAFRLAFDVTRESLNTQKDLIMSRNAARPRGVEA
ncbi:MAG: hypothetical protein KGM42_04650 [Hyphomicrobiales bacterium]|nr:hypothetical protein [Hyphomicrobiales bacterium]